MAACWTSSSSSWAWEASGTTTNATTNNSNSLLSPAELGVLQPLNLKPLQDNLGLDDHHHLQDTHIHTVGDSIGLKLGKRTYFEDAAATKSTPPPPPPAAPCQDQPLLAAVPRKKQRGPSQPPVTPTCQVEGCNADLSGSKGYHRRHRVCEVHSKTPKNIVGGIEQRFCQQCSRFHVLGEFDEGKRSCRRRLAGHNERRRKPPAPEPFSLHSAMLGGPPIYQGDLNRSMLAVQQSHPHQHLLDGTFIVNQSNKASWPDSTSTSPVLRRLIHHQHHLLSNNFYVGGPSRETIANEGVYQFLKCRAAAAASSPLISGSTAGGGGGGGYGSLVLGSGTVPLEPGIVTPCGLGTGGALSLLSGEQWGSSPCKAALALPVCSSASSSSPGGRGMSKPDSPVSHLQFPNGYHHHHLHQEQQASQKFGGQFNEFMQFTKPLEANLAYDA